MGTQLNILKSLGKIGSEQAVPYLKKHVWKDNTLLSIAALSALAHISNDEVRLVIANAAENHANKDVRLHAKELLTNPHLGYRLGFNMQ